MKKTTKRNVKVGAGVAAGVAAALAAAYLVYHNAPASKKKQVKAWVKKARNDAARELKKLKRVSAADYSRIVDKTMRGYKSLKDVSAAEVVKAAKDLKAEWKHIHAKAGKAMKMAMPKKAKKKATPKRRRAR